MALPNTGSTITMSQISNYFGGPSSNISLRSNLGSFVGVTSGSISMSSTFGGYYFP